MPLKKSASGTIESAWHDESTKEFDVYYLVRQPANCTKAQNTCNLHKNVTNQELMLGLVLTYFRCYMYPEGNKENFYEKENITIDIECDPVKKSDSHSGMNSALLRLQFIMPSYVTHAGRRKKGR